VIHCEGFIELIEQESESMEEACLFTVGHSNHPFEVFLELLKRHGIEVLVDVRSAPYSRYVFHFNREELQRAMQPTGIKYLFLGNELGGRPDGEEFYDAEGHVLYYRRAESPEFLSGIERLEKGIKQYRVAIMCSEENPTTCHRHLLVSRVLANRGVKVQHIRGDGRIQANGELPGTANSQGLLFDLVEENTWKSVWRGLRRNQSRGELEATHEE